MLIRDLLELLAPFRPLVAGTFPLGLQVAGSDLDVLCEAPDLDAFEAFLDAHPAWFAAGRRYRVESVAPSACVAQIEVSGLPVEIFAQPVPVQRQVAFRHMVVEGRLLARGGAPLADAVRAMKAAGTKTEPAFAAVLGLPGDPYAALLGLEGCGAAELDALLTRAGFSPG